MTTPPTAAEYRAVLEAVRDGLRIPHAKTEGDGKMRDAILGARMIHVLLMVEAVLDPSRGLSTGWELGYCREQLAKHPAAGYHPSTAPIAYGMYEKCAADGCGHPQGSHWEHAEPDGERTGCAFLGCTCTAYAGSIASDEAAAVLAASTGAGEPLAIACATCGQPRYAHNDDDAAIPGLCDGYDPGDLEDDVPEVCGLPVFGDPDLLCSLFATHEPLPGCPGAGERLSMRIAGGAS